MSDTPQVYVDVEFWWRSGAAPLCLTLLDGRDTVELAPDAQTIAVELHPAPDTLDAYVIDRAHLAYCRTTRRTVQPPSVTEDGVTVTGHTPQ